MTLYETAGSLGLVLAVGFLIGLQRQQTMAVEPHSRGLFVGGIRTFPLIALAGAISAMLARAYGVWIVAISLAALGVLVAIAYFDDVKHNRDRGMTSETAFVITFLLGVLALSPDVLKENRLLIVGGLGVAATALLSLKDALHDWAAKVSKEDIYATVKFLVVAVIVLPLLPTDPVWELSPRKIGLMITMIAGIGFAGYVAFRVLGAGRGMALTGLLGGLVSSTAVTLSLSGRAKEHPQIAPACAGGILLAWTVMFVRVVVVVALIHRDLAKALAVPLLAAAAAGGVFTLLVYRGLKDSSGGKSIKISNPFSLWSAIKFGALFTAVLVLSRFAVKWFGGSGLIAIGAIAGATDVDAVSLSAARFVGDGVGMRVAMISILVACGSNTIVKAAMAWVLGGAALGKRLLPAVGAMGVAAGVGALLT